MRKFQEPTHSPGVDNAESTSIDDMSLEFNAKFGECNLRCEDGARSLHQQGRSANFEREKVDRWTHTDYHRPGGQSTIGVIIRVRYKDHWDNLDFGNLALGVLYEDIHRRVPEGQRPLFRP